MKVRQKKKQSFWINNEFLVNGYAKVLKRGAIIYCVLCKYANAQTQSCFPSYETIMKESGVKNRNSIAKFLNMMDYLGLIRVRKRKERKSNIYYLLDISQWRPLNSITIDTIRKVSKMNKKEYQKWIKTSITSDTLNHISKSNKEISNFKQTRKELNRIRNYFRKKGFNL